LWPGADHLSLTLPPGVALRRAATALTQPPAMNDAPARIILAADTETHTHTHTHTHKTMKTIYMLTEIGWIRVRRCSSFANACKLAAEMQATTGIQHCVNS